VNSKQKSQVVQMMQNCYLPAVSKNMMPEAAENLQARWLLPS
jgi:hypothetical protein